jgi:hypothetical protein
MIYTGNLKSGVRKYYNNNRQKEAYLSNILT